MQNPLSTIANCYKPHGLLQISIKPQFVTTLLQLYYMLLQTTNCLHLLQTTSHLYPTAGHYEK